MPSAALKLIDDRLYGRHTKRQNLFTSFIPSHTIADICEGLLLVCFTSSGDTLLGFSTEDHSFVALHYLGIESVVENHRVSTSHQMFWKMFRKKFEVNFGVHVDDDFLLLSEGDRHALLLSTQANSSAVYTVSLKEGKICDSHQVSEDLYSDYGTVSLHQDTLILLLKRKQQFEILKLSPCGMLTLVDRIGEFSSCFDEKLVSMYPSNQEMPALNHRMLVYWWRNSGSSPQEKLRNYYRQYNTIRDMKMSAFQFLDENTLLILHEVGSDQFYFSVYNISDSVIYAVFTDNDPVLKQWLTNNIFDFILPTLTKTQASLANRNNLHCYREYLHSYLADESKQTKCSKFLPFSCQSLNISPYLNNDLFKWSMEKLSPIGSPFTCPEGGCFDWSCACRESVIFVSRNGKSNFSLPETNTIQHYTLLFHPTEPLVLKRAEIDTGQSLYCKYHLYIYIPQ